MAFGFNLIDGGNLLGGRLGPAEVWRPKEDEKTIKSHLIMADPAKAFTL